jgi:ribosomal protein S18 acetylase RimI-like enzyme
MKMNSPEIIYTNDKKLLDHILATDFFVGWPKPPSEQTLKKILQNSQHIYLAVENEKLVGFINAISDQILSAYIPLLEVLPEYQGKGIGQMLVAKIREDLSGYYMIDICCDDDVVLFYEAAGFRKGNSMILRNYKNQSGLLSSV